MKYAEIDTSNFPIIIVTFANFEPKASDFEAYLSDLENLYLHYKDFVLIFNASAARYLPSNLRVRQGYWLKENAEKIKRNCLGTAYFIPNILTNALLNCIFAISKPMVPYTVTTTFDKAMVWSKDIIEKKKMNQSNSRPDLAGHSR